MGPTVVCYNSIRACAAGGGDGSLSLATVASSSAASSTATEPFLGSLQWLFS